MSKPGDAPAYGRAEYFKDHVVLARLVQQFELVCVWPWHYGDDGTLMPGKVECFREDGTSMTLAKALAEAHARGLVADMTLAKALAEAHARGLVPAAHALSEGAAEPSQEGGPA
jgi:hypothetical protein